MGVVSHPLRFLRPRHDKGPDAPKVAPPVAGDDLLKALVLRQHQKAELGRILIAEGLAGEDQVLAALSQQYAMPRVDLEGQIGST